MRTELRFIISDFCRKYAVDVLLQKPHQPPDRHETNFAISNTAFIHCDFIFTDSGQGQLYQLR